MNNDIMNNDIMNNDIMNNDIMNNDIMNNDTMNNDTMNNDTMNNDTMNTLNYMFDMLSDVQKVSIYYIIRYLLTEAIDHKVEKDPTAIDEPFEFNTFSNE